MHICICICCTCICECMCTCVRTHAHVHVYYVHECVYVLVYMLYASTRHTSILCVLHCNCNSWLALLAHKGVQRCAIELLQAHLLSSIRGVLLSSLVVLAFHGRTPQHYPSQSCSTEASPDQQFFYFWTSNADLLQNWEGLSHARFWTKLGKARPKPCPCFEPPFVQPWSMADCLQNWEGPGHALWKFLFLTHKVGSPWSLVTQCSITILILQSRNNGFKKVRKCYLSEDSDIALEVRNEHCD